MGSMLGFMLGSMLVSSFQGVGEVRLVSSLQGMGEVTIWGFHAGFHVGFQHSGYGRGHHGKGTMGPCWVPCWVPMLVSSFQGMGEVTMGKVPWASMLGSMQGPCYIVGSCFSKKVS